MYLSDKKSEVDEREAGDRGTYETEHEFNGARLGCKSYHNTVESPEEGYRGDEPDNPFEHIRRTARLYISI